MRLNKLSILFLTILLLGTACSPVRVLDMAADDNFSLANYKTFDFYEIETNSDSLQQYSTQLDFLKQEITKQMQQRGLQRNSNNPDLKINLGIVVAEQVQTRQTNIMQDPPFYTGQRRYTWKSEEVEVRRYQHGTLSLHLVDNGRNELVWQGAAEGILPDDNQSKLQKRISEGVNKLFQQIPR